MASLKGMTEEEKRLRKRKQKNEAQKRYYQKHKEYYKNYNKDFYKNKYRELEGRIAKAVEYIKEHSTNTYFSMLQADYDMSLDILLNILQKGEK